MRQGCGAVVGKMVVENGVNGDPCAVWGNCANENPRAFSLFLASLSKRF